ncbi:MAG: glycosyltransferase [Candidatus Nanopelagicales bacterium]
MGIRFGILSTYPTTPCGIATFAEALVTHLELQGATPGVVRMVDEFEEMAQPVVAQWLAGQRSAAVEIAAVLNAYDVAVIQHEYGIFGGLDGEDLLDVVSMLEVPIISVLHTVLTHPLPNQHRVLAELCASSTALVTMTETARTRLIAGWGIDPARITVIAHGAEDNRVDPSALEVPARRSALSERPSILTWGLLGEGKGIEWALLALAELRDIQPEPSYSIVGRTHPRVLEREGEQYRDRLVGMTDALDLNSVVSFNGHYLSGPALRRIVREADVILLPYDSKDQVTSGVLTEAVAAGKPVISTSFPHAVELLSSGAGLLVPQGDPHALREALRRVLTEPGLADQMAATSHALATSLLWPAVAQSYISLSRSLMTPSFQSVA